MLTSQEAKPLGKNVRGFSLDQNLPAVQSHAGSHLTTHVKHGRLLLSHTNAVRHETHRLHRVRLSSHTHHIRHVEDAADVERSVCAVVQRVTRFIVSLSHVAIKLLVLPLADVFGLHHPERLRNEIEVRMSRAQERSEVIYH